MLGLWNILCLLYNRMNHIDGNQATFFEPCTRKNQSMKVTYTIETHCLYSCCKKIPFVDHVMNCWKRDQSIPPQTTTELRTTNETT